MAGSLLLAQTLPISTIIDDVKAKNVTKIWKFSQKTNYVAPKPAKLLKKVIME